MQFHVFEKHLKRRKAEVIGVSEGGRWKSGEWKEGSKASVLSVRVRGDCGPEATSTSAKFRLIPIVSEANLMITNSLIGQIQPWRHVPGLVIRGKANRLQRSHLLHSISSSTK